MNRFLVLCVVVAVTVSEGLGASLRNKRQVIPREFQNINIENYLKNERAVRFQLKCIIDDGPCDRIGKYLKVTIPELLVNQCANCDMAQRERAGKLVSHIQQNFPEEWERAVKKFQGGLVKPDDAARLESILGVKLSPNLVGPMPSEPVSTPATAPAAKAAEMPATSPVPVSTAAPASTPAAPASSSAAPAPVSSSAAPAPVSSSAAPETTAAAVPSTTAAAVSSSTAAATSEASTTVAAAVSSSSAAPAS